jgi:hypothetical protein
MRTITREEYREECLHIPELRNKRNSYVYPTSADVSVEKKRSGEKTIKDAEDAINRFLDKYDLIEIEGSRKITETDDFYKIEIMVNKNE